MSTSDNTAAPDLLDGFTFPVVRVRYAGPTDCRGSRYIATLRGVRHTHDYDHALEGRANAHAAALACWAKYRAGLTPEATAVEEPRVFVPGDLDANSYSFTVVPVGVLRGVLDAAAVAAAADDDEAAEPAGAVEGYAVTRTDYPEAPRPGDEFGWVVATRSGVNVTEPYRSKGFAAAMRDRFHPDSRVARRRLVWS